MELKTEVIFNEEALEDVDGIMPLNVGDVFYFSIRGTSPRSEHDYLRLRGEFSEDFLQSYIDGINKKADEYHIRQFIVTKISNGYKRDYSNSISEPKVRFTRSITVEEYDEDKENRDKRIESIVS
jgi:hypothetical protein